MNKKFIALSTLPFLALGVAVPSVAAANVSKKPSHPGAEPCSFTDTCDYEFVTTSPNNVHIDFTVSSIDCNLSTNPKTLEYSDLTICVHGVYNTAFPDGKVDNGTFDSNIIDLGYNSTGEVWSYFYSSDKTGDYTSAGLAIGKDWSVWQGNYGYTLDIPVHDIIYVDNDRNECYQADSMSIDLGF